MKGYNKTIIMGNMVADPEIATTQAGRNVCTFRLASSREWKDGSGAKNTDTLFIECTAWAGLGEVIHQFFKKGQPILVDGYLKLDTWEQDGSPRSKITLVVENFNFIGSNKREEVKNEPADETLTEDDLEKIDF